MRKPLSFLAALAAAAGLAVYLARPAQPVRAQGVALDPGLVALLPANATSLAGLDVERLKRTSIYRIFEEQNSKNGKNNGLDMLEAFTGFDPRRDVQTLLIAGWVDPNATTPEGQFLAVGRGQFNMPALSRAIEMRGGGTSENYRGFQLFAIDRDRRESKPGPKAMPKTGLRSSAAHEQGYFAFLDDKTAAAGTRAALIGAIDRKLSGVPGLAANSTLVSRAQSIGGGSQFWAVSETPGAVIARQAAKDQTKEAANFSRIAGSMKSSTLALDLSNGLDLHALNVCQTAEDARTLGDLARGLVAMGRLTMSQQNPELGELLNGIRVEERNAELEITVKVDSNVIEKLIEKSQRPAQPKAAQIKVIQ